MLFLIIHFVTYYTESQATSGERRRLRPSQEPQGRNRPPARVEFRWGLMFLITHFCFLLYMLFLIIHFVCCEPRRRTSRGPDGSDHGGGGGAWGTGRPVARVVCAQCARRSVACSFITVVVVCEHVLLISCGFKGNLSICQ